MLPHFRRAPEDSDYWELMERVGKNSRVESKQKGSVRV